MTNIIKVDQEFLDRMERLRSPERESLLEACSVNVAVFAQKMLDIRLRAWQVYAISRITNPDNLKKFFVMITSRQIGKSMAAAIFSLWCITFNKLPGGIENNTSICIISAGDVQAKKLLREIKKLINRGDVHMKNTYLGEDGSSMFGDEFFSDLLDPDAANNTSTISFIAHDPSTHGDILLKGSKSGSTVVSYSPTSSVLGETFSLVIVDEAGKTDRITDEFFYEFLLPTGDQRRAKFLILSTPWQSAGFYYRMVNPDEIYEEMDDVEVFSFDITAIELEDPEGYAIRKKQIDKLNADGKTSEVQRAYYCRFVKSEINYFDPDKVHEAFMPSHKSVRTFKEPVDIGVDFGGERNSKTVVTVSWLNEKDDNVYRMHHKYYEPGKDLSLISDIADMKKVFNIQRIIVDDCIDENEEVLMSDYSKVKLQDVNIGDVVKSWNPHTKEYEDKKVLQVFDKGEQETLEVKFKNGTSVFATPNHKWFVVNNKTGIMSLVRTKDIDVKSHYVPSAINLKGMDYFQKDLSNELFLLGVYIAEGHKRPTKKAFFISQLRPHTRDIIKDRLSKTNWVWQENSKGFYLSDIGEWFGLFNRVGKGAQNKVIPKEIFSYNLPQLQSLYDGMMMGDGHIKKEGVDKRGFRRSPMYSYYTCSPTLHEDFRYLSLLLNKPTHSSSRVKSGFGSKKEQYTSDWVEGSPMNKGKLFLKSIEKGDIRRVRDLEIEDNNTFILPRVGAITHNCPEGNYRIKEMELKGWNVTRMNFRAEKVNKYSAFRGMLNRNRLVTYFDDDLKTEMLALENNPKRARSVIGAPSGYGDDLIDSWVMSCYYFMDEDDSTGFISLGKKPVRDEKKDFFSRMEMIRDRKKSVKRRRWFDD